jgi:hypothetical protein
MRNYFRVQRNTDFPMQPSIQIPLTIYGFDVAALVLNALCPSPKECSNFAPG